MVAFTTGTSSSTTVSGFYSGSFRVYYQRIAPPPAPPREYGIADLLTIFGLPADAAPDAIRSAYRRLARQHHPDHGGDVQKMAIVNRAYDILKENGRV